MGGILQFQTIPTGRATALPVPMRGGVAGHLWQPKIEEQNRIYPDHPGPSCWGVYFIAPKSCDSGCPFTTPTGVPGRHVTRLNLVGR